MNGRKGFQEQMEKLEKHRVWRKKLGNCAVKAWGGENRIQHPTSVERENLCPGQ